MKTFFATFVAVAMTLVLNVAAAEKPEEITVAYFLEWPTANQVAQVEQWYDKAMGVKVNWRAFNSGVAMAEAMVAGEVQISYSMGGIPFMVAVSQGAPLKTVGVALSYADNDNCVVHNKAAIDRANAQALEGKKVAVPFGTVTHYKLLRTLEHLGVDTSKLELIDMVSTKGGEALARGEVTMACGWGAALLRMTAHGQVLMTGKQQEAVGIYTFDVIAVTDQFAQEHPDLIVKFLQVTDKAITHLEDDPDEAEPIIAKAAGMDRKRSNYVLSRFAFPKRNAQLSQRWMGGAVQSSLKEAADLWVKLGEMPKALDDYGPTVGTSFYEKVQD